MFKILIPTVLLFTSIATSAAQTCSLGVLPADFGSKLSAADRQLLADKGFVAFDIRSFSELEQLEGIPLLSWSQDCHSTASCVFTAELKKILVYEFPMLNLAKSQPRASLTQAIADLPDCK